MTVAPRRRIEFMFSQTSKMPAVNVRTAKIVDRAEVVDHFHQYQRHADDDRRAGQGAGRPCRKLAPRGFAQRVRGNFEHADGLFQKSRPGQQIDIGIQHQGS